MSFIFLLQVFTSVALFGILISPLNAFPWVINGLIEAWVSTKRVQAFLQLQELGQYYNCIESSPSELADSLTQEKDVSSDHEGYCSSVNREKVFVRAQRYGTVNHVATEIRQPGANASSHDVLQGEGEMSKEVSVVGIDSDICSRESQRVLWSSGGNVVEIRSGCFTWSKHDKQSADSVSSDNNRGKRLDSESSHKVLLEEDGRSEGADLLEPSLKTEWMLSDINVSIKPVG